MKMLAAAVFLTVILSACSAGSSTDINTETTETVKVEQTEEASGLKYEKPDLIDKSGMTIYDRFRVPEGFERIKTEEGSFGEYLRKLPLKPHGSKVKYYNGDIKPGEVYEAVLDVDVGKRDLQQCADSIIRLRAEYLYSLGLFDKIHFNFTNGFNAEFSKWAKGYTIKVTGNRADWVYTASNSSDYGSFRKYLDLVFSYAGTLSLSKEMEKIPPEQADIGDVFIKGATPGHCVIIVDMAENKLTGKKIFLLAQGYMPAQDMHILKNETNPDGSPWYDADFGEKLVTPEYTFDKDQLCRFKN